MDGNVIVRGIIIGIDWLVWCIKKNLEGKSIIGESCDEEEMHGERLYSIIIFF